MRRRLLVVTALLLVTGCAGPSEPLGVAVKEVPTDVVLGARRSPTPSPGPSASGPVRPRQPGPLVPPPPVVPVFPSEPTPEPPAPSPSAPAIACPSADPLAAPRNEAPTVPPAPPADANAFYRAEGTYDIGGADPRSGAFTTRAIRQVRVTERNPDGSFVFTVADIVASATTTTHYRSVPERAALPGASGLYIERVDGLRPDGTRTTFQPAPAMRVARYPLVRGDTFDVAVVDADTATAVTFTSTVTGKVRVDACGAPLDAWAVELTNGTTRGPGTEFEFTTTYAFGTQYGGIALHETLVAAGLEAGVSVTRSLRATVEREPGLAR